uniref:Uncharacterized protein n=1 Tax=Arion vulgaris TaxID=1028688 RepID=A0A0B7ALV3_9EUPU
MKTFISYIFGCYHCSFQSNLKLAAQVPDVENLAYSMHHLVSSAPTIAKTTNNL